MSPEPRSSSGFIGTAQSDLASGSLKNYIFSSQGGEADSSWLESVVFHLPPGVQSVDIPIKVMIDGVNSGNSNSIYGAALIFQDGSYSLLGSNGNHFDRIQFIENCGFDPTFTSSICSNGPASITYSDTLTIWNDVYYQFSLAFDIYGSGVIQDFSHTTQFSWDLPAGVTYTSSSGVFMTGNSAVPEPSTWMTMLAGFGAIGAMMRRASGQVKNRAYRILPT